MDNLRIAIAVVALSATGIVFIANREDYRSPAYRDIGGVPTLGYGATDGVKMGDKTTPARALARLRADASDFEVGVKRCVRVPVYQYEFDAYVALAYNVGIGAFCNSSNDPANPTLVDLINAQRYAEACERMKAFNKYRNPKTGKLEIAKGLQNAREKEYRMCIGEKVQ
jgi:lysozyme